MTNTFAILKPLYPGARKDSHEAILGILRDSGFSVLEERRCVISRADLEAHYAHHSTKPFFAPMVEYLSSGESVLLVLAHSGDAVAKLRALAGPTDPKKGAPGLIRHDFGLHHPEDIHMNAIHASGDPLEARDEASRFFGPETASRHFPRA